LFVRSLSFSAKSLGEKRNNKEGDEKERVREKERRRKGVVRNKRE
jgi:hypothetical protein